MKGCIEAFVVLGRTHENEFDAAYAEVVDPCDVIVTLRNWIRVRVRNRDEDGSLLLGLPGDLGQRRMVRPGVYVFPAEHWPDFQDMIAFLNIRASVVAWVTMRLELRNSAVLAALRAALLRRAPTFGPSYPRIAVT